MKYSQIQIKECVINAIKNYEMVTEAPHASELLPVIVDKIVLTRCCVENMHIIEKTQPNNYQYGNCYFQQCSILLSVDIKLEKGKWHKHLIQTYKLLIKHSNLTLLLRTSVQAIMQMYEQF